MSTQPSGLAIALSRVMHLFPGEDHAALNGIDFTVPCGEVAALIGPSGAGKSTLLTLLDGRLLGWSGAAMVLDCLLRSNRSPSRAKRAEIGFVFQEFALVERATVWQNVLNGRLGRTPVVASLFGRFTEADETAAEAAMRDVGILDLAEKRVDRLSGGQRQRVAIGRCLAQEPRLILADEPISNLDPHNATAILHVLANAARRRGATLVFSSHQPDLAKQVADRMVALKAGRIVLDAAPASSVTAAVLAELYGSADLSSPHLRLVV